MAYKGTDKNMQCRGFQYELGKEYSTNKDIQLCNYGFHACENPFDVFSYYPPDGKNRFFEVEQEGNITKGDDKTVSQSIKIKAELSFRQILDIGFKFVFDKVNMSKTTSQTSGYRSHSQTSGDGSHSQTSGYRSHSQTSGDRSHSQTSGDEAIACSLGIQSKAKSINGWIVVVDWRYKKDKWFIHEIYHAKVGQKIKRQTIKPDMWYWFENGKLNSSKDSQ